MLGMNDHDDGSNDDRNHDGDGYHNDSDDEDEDGDAERRRPEPYWSAHSHCTAAPHLLELKKSKQGIKQPPILSQRQDRTENQRGTFSAHTCIHMQRRTSPPVSQSSQGNASEHDASMNQSL